MRIQAKLCHIDAERCVVQVSAWHADNPLGSALGEGKTAESAEDRALERLLQRLGNSKASGYAPVKEESKQMQSTKSAKQPLLEKGQAIQEKRTQVEELIPMPSSDGQDESPKEPDDWSEELAAIDLELQRIGWNRDQEKKYLERAFGHSSRLRITKYGDLIAFLKRLKQIQPGERADQAAGPVRRSDLLIQSDQVLNKLNWTPEQGRSFLKEQLKVNSRQQLSDEQLLRFNTLLEGRL